MNWTNGPFLGQMNLRTEQSPFEKELLQPCIAPIHEPAVCQLIPALFVQESKPTDALGPGKNRQIATSFCSILSAVRVFLISSAVVLFQRVYRRRGLLNILIYMFLYVAWK